MDLKVKVERKFIRTEKVKLLMREAELSLIEESISNEYLGWKAVNKFWVDKNMFVWKTRFLLFPDIDHSKTTVPSR